MSTHEDCRPELWHTEQAGEDRPAGSQGYVTAEIPPCNKSGPSTSHKGLAASLLGKLPRVTLLVNNKLSAGKDLWRELLFMEKKASREIRGHRERCYMFNGNFQFRVHVFF